MLARHSTCLTLCSGMSIALVSSDAFRAIASLYFVIRYLVASFIFFRRQPRREQGVVLSCLPRIP